MAISDLKRLPESQLDHLEQLLASWQDAVADGGGEDECALIADFLVDEALGVKHGLKRFWEYRWRLATSGSAPILPDEYTALRNLFTRGGIALKEAASTARAFANRSGREVARLVPFEENANSFAAWRDECLAQWEMLNRPRPHLDHARVAKSRAAFARGDCEEAASLMERLKRE